MMDSREENLIGKGLEINGIVQGVGFRPFVYRLAGRFNVKGEIANTSSGVSAHIEGTRSDIEAFLIDLREQCPPLARITDITLKPEPYGDLATFVIAGSRARKSVSTLISPDVSVCDDCLRELFDPHDRRYLYPFINCTNCGPRYTIIDRIPYDRPNTSMRHFQMCEACRAEYDDPNNRRFHAQPNACFDCGPRVVLYNHRGERVDWVSPVERAVEFLKQGLVVAIKGLGGFHLAADAQNSEAVARLRKRKLREEKPFAVMSYDLEKIREYARVDPEEEEILTSPQRPIVLLKKRDPHTLSEEISPGNKYFGVMLPYTPLHYLILNHGFTALVMTSGNRSEEPIAMENGDALDRLSSIADYFLVHDRVIYLRSDDSIVRRVAGSTRFIRRSRGYVPVPVFLKRKGVQVLACGAELKNTICLTRDDKAFLSQHIGDLENLASYEFFRMTIEHLKRILHMEPQVIAYDLHPDYLSTRYAEEQEGMEKIRVQHHHAHIAGCMAENGLEGQVIGLSFDGTGYGTDGAIWGGELLICGMDRFKRKAAVSYVPMPGGSAAIKEPWRMAISYLYEAYGEDFKGLDLGLLRETDEKRVNLILEMIKKHIHSPLTSSLGRLFDGVAAIAGLRTCVHYEGQAAMELEMIADEGNSIFYDYEWEAGDPIRVMPGPMVRGVVEDLKRGVGIPVISGKFHATIIRLFSALCEQVKRETGLDRVLLSGGVFQNAILLKGFIKDLESRRFKVYTHSIVPTNDGGISLGQAVVAREKAVTGNK